MMKLREIHRSNHEHTIGSALHKRCDSHCYGVAETALDKANAAVDVLGELITKLHAEGALTDRDVLDLLPYGLEIVG